MKNIVIYGGGFDPIHNGHLNMALNASKELDAEVFFVPAHVSVWKERSEVTDEDKVKMVELAIKYSGCPRFHLSLFEIENKQDSNYTIDTVKHFKEEYPDSNLYLLIGTDQANKFDQWKECEELAKLSQITVFERPDYTLDQKNVDRFNILILKGEQVDAAASEIRACKSLNVPYPIIEYIISHELYFTNRIKSYMKERRYLHSVSVAKLAYEIAEANHINDSWKYYMTGLLHDIGKDLPISEQKAVVEAHFIEYKDFPPQIIHQFVGRYIAENEFGINDEEILDAIEYHTTGHPGMNLMAKIVYAADKIEPTRGFDGSELIHAMKVNAEQGFITVLEANKEYFVSRNIPYDNFLTKATMEKFIK